MRVLLADVTELDLDRREVVLHPHADGGGPTRLAYDTLVVSGGSSYSTFGHDDWRPFAPELARDALAMDFRSLDPTKTQILLVEMADRVLGTFPPVLSRRAARALEGLGVTPLLGHRVVGVHEEGVDVETPDGATRRFPARTVIWAAGVKASPLAAALARATGAELDRTGRVTVQPDLTLPGHPEVLALGDMVRVATPGGEAVALPGLAPVAMQQGRYAGRLIGDRLAARATPPFHHVDKANRATIGRAKAVADVRGVRVSGLLAWLTWLVVHLFYLVGFQNRVLVVIRWTVSFVTRGRGARLIAHEAPPAGAVADDPPAVAVHAGAGGPADDRAHALDRS